MVLLLSVAINFDLAVCNYSYSWELLQVAVYPFGGFLQGGRNSNNNDNNSNSSSSSNNNNNNNNNNN